MRLGGIVDKPAAWKKRGRPRLLAVEDPQVCVTPEQHLCMRSMSPTCSVSVHLSSLYNAIEIMCHSSQAAFSYHSLRL